MPIPLDTTPGTEIVCVDDAPLGDLWKNLDPELVVGGTYIFDGWLNHGDCCGHGDPYMRIVGFRHEAMNRLTGVIYPSYHCRHMYDLPIKKSLPVEIMQALDVPASNPKVPEPV